MDRGARTVDRPCEVEHGRSIEPVFQQRQRVTGFAIGHLRGFGGHEGFHVLVEQAQRQEAARAVIIFQRGFDGVGGIGGKIRVAGADRAAITGDPHRGGGAQIGEARTADVAVGADPRDQVRPQVQRDVERWQKAVIAVADFHRNQPGVGDGGAARRQPSIVIAHAQIGAQIHAAQGGVEFILGEGGEGPLLDGIVGAGREIALVQRDVLSQRGIDCRHVAHHEGYGGGIGVHQGRQIRQCAGIVVGALILIGAVLELLELSADAQGGTVRRLPA